MERPQLLAMMPDDSSHDNDDEVPLPLVDGCDIPGWRAALLVPLSPSLSCVQNVGAGCSLLRRDSQLPMVPSSSLKQWRRLQEKFLQEPVNGARRICKKDALELPRYPWFERESVPVVLEGLADDWKAMETCRWNNLVKEYGDFFWRFSDTHGAGMTLETYQKYISTFEGMTDDAPLAVYDSQLATDDRAELLQDYKVPECFAAPDLFEGLGEEERPPYRWILVGPARSGTGLHVDPMGTHAWVTVVEGLKRWVLFPRDTDLLSIHMLETQIPSALWFSQFYEEATTAVPGAIEVLQRPGETVYVPAGWPHLVLNLEFTVAVTHNYATEYPCMDQISQAVKTEEPDLYIKWMEVLHEYRPDLVTNEVGTALRKTECAVDILGVSEGRVR